MSAKRKPEPWVTYRRADGDEIFGEYSFVTGTDGLDDCDEGAAYVKETWKLVSAEEVWFGPPERLMCEACRGEGTVVVDDGDTSHLADCLACEGEGTVAP